MSHLPLLLALLACAPKSGVVEDAPSYTTDEGRRAVWHDLARWYIDNRAPEQALEMVKRIRETGYDDDELIMIQARAILALGLADEARVLLEGLHGRRPRDPEVLAALGIVYSDVGLYELAAETLQSSVKLRGDNAAVRNNLGFILLGLGRCEEAKEQLEAVMVLDATNPRYRHNLAFSLVCLGDPQRALKLFRSTLPEAEARFNMGIAYERLEKYPSAILQYREVLQVSPDHPAAREALSRLAPLGLDPSSEGAQ